MRGDPRLLEGLTCVVKDDYQVKDWRHHWGTLLMKDVEPTGAEPGGECAEWHHAKKTGDPSVARN